MEKIIFFVLIIPILGFVLYSGILAIMKGFNERNSKNNSDLSEDNENPEMNNSSKNYDNLSEELNKLNDLLIKGVLTQEEFEKAKKKILGD
ncbi:MAG: SHOCT domain-containing protein [Alphaproteobacteria bacterium]|nr:SHOCT domain-containing protein [Alphaproteobacteria bacterium]